MNWKVPQELMQSEGSRIRRSSYTEIDVLWHNGMEWTSLLAAMQQSKIFLRDL